MGEEEDDEEEDAGKFIHLVFAWDRYEVNEMDELTIFSSNLSVTRNVTVVLRWTTYTYTRHDISTWRQLVCSLAFQTT